MSGENAAILILLASFFAMIFLRFPIAYAVALSSVFCLLYQGLPLATICQQMVKGISTFSLMAVPFFIVMGCLMGSGGISEKLIAMPAWDGCGAAWPWSILWHPIFSEGSPVPLLRTRPPSAPF